MSTTIQSLLYAGFRIAGVTDRPGRTPSTDQLADAISTVNRMLDGWNCDRLKIFSIGIAAYDLIANQKTYTIGDGGDFDAARPEKIEGANIILTSTSPVVRRPVRLLTDEEWRGVTVQDIAGTIPWALYNDGNFPLSSLYLYGQPLSNQQLELYTWQAIPTFSALSDTVELPPGYEEAITYNLACRLATGFPTQQKMMQESWAIAREALMRIESVNAPAPVMRCDSAVLQGRRAADPRAYLSGDY